MKYEELKVMFKGYEDYVEINKDNTLQVHDFMGFDEDWDEIEIDLPAIVMERLSVCELMGIKILYDSADI